MKSSDEVLRNSSQGERRSKRFAEFQRIITRLSSEFINMPLEKLDDAMKSAMASVGDFCDIFRSSIWTFNWKINLATRLVGWNRHMPDTVGAGFTLPFSEIAPIMEYNGRGEVFSAGSGDEMMKRISAKLNLHIKLPCSMNVFPLMIGDNLLGAIALLSPKKNKAFTETEKNMIRIFAHLIANVLRRKERELELRLHYENDRLILDSISEGVVMFDRDGTVININRRLAETFGGAVEDIIGTHISAHFPMMEYGAFQMNRKEKITYTYDTGIPCVFEDSMDGMTFSNRCFPVRRDGLVCAVALFTSDITPQKRAMEETTKRAEYQARLRVITDFFTNISHEFKTPLTLVFNAEKLIEARVQNVGECQNKEYMLKYLGVMRQNINRLLRLIGNLLDVTKLDSGFMQVNLQELDVTAWLGAIISSIEDYAAHRGINVAVTVIPPVRTLLTDVDKMERILLNLLSNSIKHTQRGGHIRVTLSGTADAVTIAVEDDGEGIPDDKKDIIFDRFKQVNTSLTRASEGSGIGLALSKLLVELLGGRIWFDSRYGKGSVFYVEIPMAKQKKKSKTSFLDGMDISRKVEMEFSDIQ